MRNLRSVSMAICIASAVAMPQAANATPIPIAGMNLTLGGVLKTVGLAADLVTLFGIPDNDAGSDSINISASGDETNFNLRIRGTELDDTTTTHLTGTLFGQTVLPGGGVGKVTLWSFDLDMQFWSVQDSLIFNEQILTNGHVMHEIGPHQKDALQGPQLGFNLRVNADDAKNKEVMDTDPLVSLLHPAKHTDELFTSRLHASTESTLVLDEILNWDLTLRARHIPEPSTLTLLLAGMGLGFLRRTIRRQKGPVFL